MKACKGFTLVELMIVVTLLAIVTTLLSIYVGNNRGATESRAKTNAEAFVSNNNIAVKRLTCAGDSDGDGYGSCTVVTTSNERIPLKCPTDFVDIYLFGASECKEVVRAYDVNQSFN